MSLPFKGCAEIGALSPQTLRFYHSEGLLVSAEADEGSG